MIDRLKYEHKSVRVRRGAGGSTREKLEEDGWEVVGEDPGKLRTMLTLRRARTPKGWLTIGGPVVAVIVIAAVITVGALTEDRPAPDADSSSADHGDEGSGEDSSSEVITVENNEDLAALFAGPARGKSVEEFVDEYNGATISFDAFVAGRYINPRETFGESYLRFKAGDEGDLEPTGPLFEISWYGHDPKKGAQDEFKKGDDVRVTATVGVTYDFAPHQLYLVEDEDAVVPVLQLR